MCLCGSSPLWSNQEGGSERSSRTSYAASFAHAAESERPRVATLSSLHPIGRVCSSANISCSNRGGDAGLNASQDDLESLFDSLQGVIDAISGAHTGNAATGAHL